MTSGKTNETAGERPMLRRSQLRRLLNLSHDIFRKMEAAGELPAPVMLRGMPRWPMDEVHAWVAKLPRREVVA